MHLTCSYFFFFNDTATTEIYTLSLHDALPICFDQFNDLCKMVIERPEYCGTEFSWGDFYIYKCAHNQDGLGNATTWRQVGTTHHIEFVARPLASYFAA